MTADILASAAATGLPWSVSVASPGESGWADALPAPWEPQVEGDLGARLAHALRGGGLAVGTDSPTLPVSMIQEAARRLADHDVVFIPAFDGGYVLAGVRPHALGVFDGVPWSAPDTHAASVERVRALGLRHFDLPYWYDVDEPRDLPFLRTHLRALDPRVAPRTRTFFEEQPDAPPLR